MKRRIGMWAAFLFLPHLAWGYEGMHCNYGTPNHTSVHLTELADGSYTFEFNHGGGAASIPIHSGVVNVGDLEWLAKKAKFMSALGEEISFRFLPGECEVLSHAKVGICTRKAGKIGEVDDVEFSLYFAPKTIVHPTGESEKRLGFTFDYTVPATSPYLDGEDGNRYRKYMMSVDLEYPLAGCRF